ncbi:MAG: aminoacyl-tRNA hydrolase [Moraxellaceae bacterium]|nr:aminoacyl-tRNA hydrolase [Moraxellaceae bacterium]MBK8325572.1 aminoacyl-tRNA hydrolase [Moraxellaceae bacterium]MBL0231088.1 aminoacyl-tRNA hydrolase [Moraxellaceae bacterium]
MANVQLIVGLGNPGLEYAHTRHNAGVWFVAALAEQYNIRLSPESKYYGLAGRGQINGQEVRLLIPTTFMNRSGQAVAALANFFKISPDAILVAHDELDLPVGSIRLKTGGGHGGHNGLRDIVSSLGNQSNFHRLRIGIAHPGDAKLVSNYVLGKAPQAEQEKIEDAIMAAVKVSDLMVNGNLAKAMNQLNGFKA